MSSVIGPSEASEQVPRIDEKARQHSDIYRESRRRPIDEHDNDKTKVHPRLAPDRDQPL